MEIGINYDIRENLSLRASYFDNEQTIATRDESGEGAEIVGLDFNETLTDLNSDKIYNLLIENKVIFFRNKKMSPETHIKFAKSLGDIEPPHPVYPNVQNYPEIVLLENNNKNPPDTDVWHTDVTFKPNPPFASILYSQTIPPVGGDTLWSVSYTHLTLPTKRIV